MKTWNNKNLSTKRKAFSKQFENEFKTELFFQFKKIINQCRFSGLIDPKTVEQRDRKFPSPKCGLAGPYNDTVRDFALVIERRTYFRHLFGIPFTEPIANQPCLKFCSGIMSITKSLTL